TSPTLTSSTRSSSTSPARPSRTGTRANRTATTSSTPRARRWRCGPGSGTAPAMPPSPPGGTAAGRAVAGALTRDLDLGRGVVAGRAAPGRQSNPLHHGDPGDHQRTADQLARSEEHTSELQSRENLVCRLLLEKKKLI